MIAHLAHLRLAIGGILLALGLTLVPTPGAAQPATAPIKIGVVAPLTGVLAVIAKGDLNGIRLRLKELNYEIAGRKVELIVEDDTTDAPTGLTKVRKLVERDKVDVLLGPLATHVVAAVQDYVGQKGVPQMPLVPGFPEHGKYRTTLMPGYHPVQPNRLLGQWAYSKLGHRKAIVMSAGFAAGTRMSQGFREGFTAAGGAIVHEVYPPLGTADFSPYLAALPQADAVYSFFPGADAVRYVKQRRELGLSDRLPLLAFITTVDGMLLPAQGDAALGSLAITYYFESLDNPVNRHFVAAYAKEYGESPRGYYPSLGYTLVQILEAALKQTGGKTTPADALAAAMRRVDFASPQGRYRFDPEKPYPITDYYIVKVVKKEGTVGYEIVDVLKDVKPE